MHLDPLIRSLRDIPSARLFGRIVGVNGLLVEVAGAEQMLGVGSRLAVEPRNGPIVRIEVVGFRGDRAQCLPYGPIEGLGVGCRAFIEPGQATIAPSDAWLGRVINGLGEPIDSRGPLPSGPHPRTVRAGPPPAQHRDRVGAKIDVGVRALNIFAPACRGQRLGIFAGSGVGKSVLLSMLARYTDCDVAVIGLIGERGREVQEFIEDDLGAEGLARSVVVVATSDEPSLTRRQAAYMTLAVAEHFRDQGKHVLCLMDSVTRFAMAQREIGLACGEPPATKGYTPTVFSELPKLLERAGPGLVSPEGQPNGAITGLFTVLVDGDDHNEPVADAVRGTLDGHIVMSRQIAERGRYPAINVLKSVSRTLPDAHNDEENRLMREARRHLSVYADMEEMIRLGAYRSGADASVDAAIALNGPLEALLNQGKRDHSTRTDTFAALAQIVDGA